MIHDSAVLATPSSSEASRRRPDRRLERPPPGGDPGAARRADALAPPIVAAADAQRRRLEQEFRHGPERRFADVERTLRRRGRRPWSRVGESSPTRSTTSGPSSLRQATEAAPVRERIHPARSHRTWVGGSARAARLRAVVPVTLDCAPGRLPRPSRSRRTSSAPRASRNLASMPTPRGDHHGLPRARERGGLDAGRRDRRADRTPARVCEGSSTGSRRSAAPCGSRARKAAARCSSRAAPVE